MVVKFIAALAYTATWAVIIIGIFHPIPFGLWCMVGILAVVGALSAWNALPQPQRDGHPSHRGKASQDCDTSRNESVIPIRPVETPKP